MRLTPLLCAVLLALQPVYSAGTVQFSLSDLKGDPLADAVVSLVPLDGPAKLAPPAQPIELVQRGQEFAPHVLPIVVGTAVLFPNRDTIQHHVYSLSKPKKFELPLYGGESKEAIVFDQPGVVAIGCNIHDWMSAYLVVLETPWFARTGADGLADVADVPAGRYRADIWHPRMKETESREITVPEGKIPPVALKLKRDLRIRRAPDAASGGYK